MTEQVIIGYSGHSYVVLDAALESGLNVVAYTENKESSLNPYKLEYIGLETNDNFIGWEKEYEFILGIGDNRIREKATQLIISKNKSIRSVIHPSAIIGSRVNIDTGTFIGAGVMINPLVKTGKSVIINTGAIVEHECNIGNYVHIAPGAVLAGNVNIGNRTFIGANTVIKEGVTIGENVIIGAGSVVINDVISNGKVVGNPGRYI